MNRTRPLRPIRRLAGILAALVTTLLAAATTAPAALALPVPPGDGGGMPPAPLRTVVVGGMAGWQIALIATAAGVAGAAIAVLLDRARTTRRHQPAPSA